MIHQAYNHVVISLTAMRGVISRPLFLFCQIYSVEALFWRGSSCGAASVCLSVPSIDICRFLQPGRGQQILLLLLLFVMQLVYCSRDKCTCQCVHQTTNALT